MNRKERAILRNAAGILRQAASLKPLNPADIRRVSIACRVGSAVAQQIANALDSATDESCGGISGAVDNLDLAREELKSAEST